MLKIGVQSPLLSFNALSIASLSEPFVRSLVQKSVIRENVFSSPLDLSYLNKAELTEASESLKSVSKSLFLAKSASCFEIKNKKLYMKSTCNMYDFLNIKPYLFSSSRSPYKIKIHQKGSFVVLEKQHSNLAYDVIKIQKIKSLQDGFTLLAQKKIDVFFPLEKSHHKLDQAFENVHGIFSKNLDFTLRLYKKSDQKDNPTFEKVLFENKSHIQKILGPSWSLLFFKNPSRNQSSVKSISLVSNTQYVSLIFDILSTKYKNKTGKKIQYKKPSPKDLTSKLKEGDFEYYLTEDIEKKEPLIFKEAYHSDGKYNTLRIKNKKLDHLLEELETSKSLSEFMKKSTQAQKLISQILPLIFEFRSPLKLYTHFNLKKLPKACHWSSLNELIFKPKKAIRTCGF